LTDEQIVAQLKQGNVESFKELIQRYENRIAATVMGMLGACPEADDLGQEVFIRFYKNINNFRSEASVITYLTRIAINLSINELKSRKRRSMLFLRKENLEESQLPGSEDLGYDNTERKAMVNKAIQKLDVKFRSVIVLRLIDGYSTEETANILSIPLGTVLSRLARGQMKLKELLAPIIEESL